MHFVLDSNAVNAVHEARHQMLKQEFQAAATAHQLYRRHISAVVSWIYRQTARIFPTVDRVGDGSVTGPVY